MPENPASYRVVRTKSYLFNKASLHINTQKCLGSNFNTFASPPPCFCNFSH
ncbi:TPA: hypothetical protein MFM13_005211 [Klebsiella pneumoniae]|nr:hypothetical protein [Klebsiella pneumoniae]